MRKLSLMIMALVVMGCGPAPQGQVDAASFDQKSQPQIVGPEIENLNSGYTNLSGGRIIGVSLKGLDQNVVEFYEFGATCGYIAQITPTETSYLIELSNSAIKKGALHCTWELGKWEISLDGQNLKMCQLAPGTLGCLSLRRVIPTGQL